MKNLNSKTYNFGSLTISVFSTEIVVILRTKKTVYVKSFKRRFALLFRTVLLLTGVVLSILFLINTFGSMGLDQDTIDEDLKNSILVSSKTDFSEPVPDLGLKIQKHLIKKGDTLSGIAAKFGVSVDTICGCNNLKSYDFIRQGQVLDIPNKDGILRKIKSNVSLISLSKKYKVSLEKIIKSNSFKNSDFIAVGETIFIPDAKPQNIIAGFMWPTRGRYITAGYGWRRNPFNRRRRQFHSGLDIRTRYQWLRSSKYGKVTYAGWLGGYGKAIVIAHPGGWKTLYGHMSRIIVRKGQYVKQGQNIGKSGNTGRSTGPHLHFEIIKRGKHKNPYVYLKRNR